MFKIIPISEKTSIFLDGARALSAILVVLGHLSGLIFIPFASNQLSLKSLFYLVHGFAHQAVIIFFVLSGYLVGRKTFLWLENPDRPFWRPYLIDRLSRLYLVEVPGLFLTLLFDGVGLSLFPTSPLYYPRFFNREFYHVSIADTFTFKHFVSNLFFMQRIFGPEPFGSNIPLWTIAFEFWSYLAFPVCVFAVAFAVLQKKFRPFLIIFSLLWLGFLIMNPTTLRYFATWCLGASIHYCNSLALGRRISKTWFWVASALLGTVLVSIGPGLFSMEVSDWMLAIFFSLMIFCLQASAPDDQSNSAKASSSCVARTAKALASFSYSLYVLHFPPMALLYAYAISKGFHKVAPSLISISALYAITGAILVYAWAFSRLTEQNTPRLRNWLRRKLRIDQAPKLL